MCQQCDPQPLHKEIYEGGGGKRREERSRSSASGQHTTPSSWRLEDERVGEHRAAVTSPVKALITRLRATGGVGFQAMPSRSGAAIGCATEPIIGTLSCRRNIKGREPRRGRKWALPPLTLQLKSSRPGACEAADCVSVTCKTDPAHGPRPASLFTF